MISVILVNLDINQTTTIVVAMITAEAAITLMMTMSKIANQRRTTQMMDITTNTAKIDTKRTMIAVMMLILTMTTSIVMKTMATSRVTKTMASSRTWTMTLTKSMKITTMAMSSTWTTTMTTSRRITT